MHLGERCVCMYGRCRAVLRCIIGCIGEMHPVPGKVFVWVAICVMSGFI